MVSSVAGAEPVVEIHKTNTGVVFGTWGPLPNKPVPTLIVLGSTMEGTLGSAYFRQCGNQLAKAGYLLISVDLPCHGKEHRANEPAGLAGWAYRCEQGEDFVADINQRLTQVIDYLVSTKITNADKIAVCGTSRGGYLAIQFAAHDQRVKAVAAFAPVTDLTVLREFKTHEKNPLVPALALMKQAEKLAGRPVWIIIGDRDERVGTDDSIAVARAITKSSLSKGLTSRVDIHVIAEPRGHTVPPGATELAGAWFQRQMEPQESK
tara:strand:+ start:12561 stop:13352 length:792 start_codon:yes stop_codon:yes gene_type:complete